MFARLSEGKVARWLKNRFDVRLGAQLWALELELPRSMRRTRKFSLLARVVGRLYAAGVISMAETKASEDYRALVEHWAWLALAEMPEGDAGWTLTEVKPSEADQDILQRAGKTNTDLLRDVQAVFEEIRPEADSWKDARPLVHPDEADA